MFLTKKIVAVGVLMTAGVAVGEARLLKVIPFESEKEIQAWPGDCTIELDDEEKTEGKTSIVFTPDNNFCAYVWQAYQPGKTYTAVFDVKADKAPIPRITFAVNFKGAGNATVGTFSRPIRDLVPCDGRWHQARATFTCPAGANRGQTMLAMFRCNATVFVDNLRIYEGVPEGAADAPAAVSAPAGRGKLLIEVEFEGAAPKVTNVREVR
ncbi:MAG: hypothetical protein ACI4RD_10075 [Kiritimatiellia bacterium]